MNNKTTNRLLRRAIRLALYASLVSATAVPVAMAQEEDVEEVIVTGSRIQRNISESASPISIYSSEDIEAGGYTTIEDFIQNIPEITGANLGSTVNNGNSGYATAALRGLGENRTLILVNGRRFNSGDLNSIPAAFIERVEVLKDGASTIYGSDAIAGVINFITKKDFEGAEFTAQYDVTGEGDGEITNFSLAIGNSSERGHVAMGISYTDRKEIWQGDRSFSECPIWEIGREKICGGSGTSYPGGVINTGIVDVDGDGIKQVVDNGVTRDFIFSDTYNYAAESYMVTPQTLYSIYGNGRYDLLEGDVTSVSTLFEAGFTNRMSEQLMAPVGTFWGPTVPATNPANIWGQDVNVYRRMVETGGRRFTQDVSEYSLLFGFDGELSNNWNWDVSYSYARSVETRIEYGRANVERFETLLDPDLCAADADCPGVWDPFSTNTFTEEMEDYATITHSPVRRGATKQLMFNLVGDSGDFELPGGQIQWAFGIENREETLLDIPDGGASLGLIYNVGADVYEGEYSVDEFYGEVLLPVVADSDFAKRLDLNISARNTSYDYLSGSNTSLKFGIEWEPMDGLVVRATLADGFRGATIDELFAAREVSHISYNDPCENWGLSSNANVRANCAAEGVPDDWTLASDQAASWIGGNSELEPEESESTTIGFTFTPDAAPNFTMSMDYFNIKVTDAIGTVGVGNIVNGCYESAGFSSPLCDLIEGPDSIPDTAAGTYGDNRDGQEAIAGVILTNLNLTTIDTSGIDFDFRYTFDDVLSGSMELGLQGTYMLEYEYVAYDGADPVDTIGYVDFDSSLQSLAAFPEIRANLSVNYTTDKWSALWVGRYQSETTDIDASDANLDNVADSVLYHDVQASYQANESSTFTFGIRNLLDEEAPYISNYDDMNTINMSYDLAGRYMYARATFQF